MGVQGRNSVVANPMQRVKVYRLNDEGKWDDRGTGHVTVEYLEQSEAVGLIVIDEEDSETLLIHRISAEDIYRRQEDTIIAWRDPEIATELALSFQETMGCCFIWDQICGVQRSIHFPSVGGLEVGPRPSNDDLEHSGTSQGNDDSFHGASSELRELPPVELSTLPLILKTVMEGCSVDHYRVAELIVQDQRFLPKLLDLFKICEDLENIDGLHLIFKIMKGIIMLNSSQIFENIFNDEYIMGVVGALEYDPEFPCRQEHRAFLREHVLFKEAIPIRDPSLLSKIHQTYRVGYIKDVILPRVLDEPTFATLNSIIQSNNAAVVSSLKDDGSFIHELFARLKSSEASDQTKKNLVLFLQEFCSLSKSLQLVHQMRLFRDLVNEGLFEIITNALQSQEKLLRLNGTDILIVVLNQDPTLLRTFVMQPEGNALLGLLVKGMSTDFGEDLHSQYLEIIRMLLDPYTIAGPQRDSIIELFYDKYMDQLVDVITRSCPAKENTEMSRKSTSNDDGTGSLGPVGPDILSNICELLCFCVLQHPYRIKSYFLRNGVIEKVLCLTRRKEKYLVVAAVRFLRTIISRNDDRVHRDIVKYNLFDPVIRAFIANGNRYNLLNSAVLELVEYIRKENIKCLIVYLVEKFSDKMEKIDCADTFHALKLRYEQFLEGCPMGNVSSGGKGDGGIPSNHSRQISSISDPRKRMDERGLEKEEEDYFNEDSDDEEDSASARINHTSNQSAHPVMVNGNASTYSSFRGGSIGLVDYEDEDDSPEPGSSTKVSEVVKSNSMVSSFEMNDPLGHDVVDFANAKRKLDAIECNDGESESLKKRRLHTHTKAFSASADSIDRIEQFVSKEKHASSTFNHERDVESHRVEVDTGLERSAAGEESTIQRVSSNGCENSIAEARNGGENHGSSSVSTEGSGSVRAESAVKGNNSLKGNSCEGKVSSAPSELVRAGPPSPEPYTVR
eukprot:Gb_07616 [translate_table: standard]